MSSGIHFDVKLKKYFHDHDASVPLSFFFVTHNLNITVKVACLGDILFNIYEVHWGLDLRPDRPGYLNLGCIEFVSPENVSTILV